MYSICVYNLLQCIQWHVWSAVVCVYTSSTFIFPGGIPQAAVLVQINQALFILFTTLSCLGILFAFACLIFNLVFREKQ